MQVVNYLPIFHGVSGTWYVYLDPLAVIRLFGVFVSLFDYSTFRGEGGKCGVAELLVRMVEVAEEPKMNISSNTSRSSGDN